jgi:hypothetical protein
LFRPIRQNWRPPKACCGGDGQRSPEIGDVDRLTSQEAKARFRRCTLALPVCTSPAVRVWTAASSRHRCSGPHRIPGAAAVISGSPGDLAQLWNECATAWRRAVRHPRALGTEGHSGAPAPHPHARVWRMPPGLRILGAMWPATDPFLPDNTTRPRLMGHRRMRSNSPRAGNHFERDPTAPDAIEVGIQCGSKPHSSISRWRSPVTR